MNDQHLLDFEKYVATQIPGFKVGYKDQSKMMRFLGFLLKPFNPEFMTSFTTTWGNSVYFPTEEFYEKNTYGSMSILAHEFVHLWDSQRQGFWAFKATYALPQVLGLLPLAAFGVLGGWPALLVLFGGYLLGALLPSKALFWLVFGPALVGALVWGWLSIGYFSALLLLVVALIFLPSKWRTHWELRGYTMNIAFHKWVTGRRISQSAFDSIKGQFTGPNYLFMCWGSSKIDKELRLSAQRADSGTLQTNGPYQKVYEFLENHGLMAR